MSDTKSAGKSLRSDALLSALRGRLYPNCTLYLIWHYVQQGDMDAARREYSCDHDKLGVNRELVERVLSDAGLHRTSEAQNNEKG